jgi:hypothetical protein
MFGATFIAGSQSFFASDAAALISCATFLFDSTIQWFTKGYPLMKHCPATFRTIRGATRAKLRDNPCIEQRDFLSTPIDVHAYLRFENSDFSLESPTAVAIGREDSRKTQL